DREGGETVLGGHASRPHETLLEQGIHRVAEADGLAEWIPTFDRHGKPPSRFGARAPTGPSPFDALFNPSYSHRRTEGPRSGRQARPTYLRSPKAGPTEPIGGAGRPAGVRTPSLRPR